MKHIKVKKNSIGQKIGIKSRLADFIFMRIYGSNFSGMPIFLQKFVIDNIGGWLGSSITAGFINYEMRKKREKNIKARDYIILILLILILGIPNLVIDYHSFISGFSQNLLSDIVLLLLISYFLPKLLNKRENYKISIYRNVNFEECFDNKQEVLISLCNTGDEVFKEREIYWELFLSKEYFFGFDYNTEDISIINGQLSEQIENNLSIFNTRLYGYNEIPLFLNQKLELFKIRINKEIFENKVKNPIRIYYRIYTINGNMPEYLNLTPAFLGIGLSEDRYPLVGEIILNYEYIADTNIKPKKAEEVVY